MRDETGIRSTDSTSSSHVPNVSTVRAAINLALSSSGVNPIAVGNQVFIAKKKRAILYKNGYTVPGKAAALLHAEAVSGIAHSQKLARNMTKALPRATRAADTDAHHVVAAEASAARPSRVLIFALGIGINDADNGVILPRHKMAIIPAMPNASPHQHIHTFLYHTNVITELYAADDTNDEQEVRGILRSIGRRLLNGQFGY